MRRRNLAVLVSLSLMGTMSMTGYAASEKETTTEAASTEAESKSADQEAADKVADLIDAIYVQDNLFIIIILCWINYLCCIIDL